jgi:uncharacterized membrane protein YfcA
MKTLQSEVSNLPSSGSLNRRMMGLMLGALVLGSTLGSQAFAQPGPQHGQTAVIVTIAMLVTFTATRRRTGSSRGRGFRRRRSWSARPRIGRLRSHTASVPPTEPICSATTIPRCAGCGRIVGLISPRGMPSRSPTARMSRCCRGT